MSDAGAGTNTGRIVEIKGVVIDAVFPDRLPAIYNALAIEVQRPGGATETLIAEVQQHLGDDRVRAVAMDSTDGMPRGALVTDTNGPISVPVGDATLGRLWNVTGDPIDEKEPAGSDVERWPIHRDPPAFRDLSPKLEIFETGMKVIDLHRPVRQGREGRALRRCRSRQDGAHPGAHPQRRDAARRLLGLHRRGRALARGQRSPARDGRSPASWTRWRWSSAR